MGGGEDSAHGPEGRKFWFAAGFRFFLQTNFFLAH
jgi:hypothetical protein